MRSKNPRIVARNMRWVSLALGACLILSLIFCLSLFLSRRSAAKEYDAKIADLNSGMREIIVTRLDHESDIYDQCARYLTENQTTAMAAYLAGARDLTGTTDLTDAAWNRLFPEDENQTLRGLCDKLNEATADLSAEKLANLTEDQRATLASLFQQLADTLDRDSTFPTLPQIIGAEKPEADKIKTEIDSVNSLLSQIDTLFMQASSNEPSTQE